MSDTATVSSGVQPANYSGATGSDAALDAHFGPGMTYAAVLDSGLNTVAGALVIGGTGTSQTIAGAHYVDDANKDGSQNFLVIEPTVIIAAPNDTITAAAAATTLFGGDAGITRFSLGGSGSSVIGGLGDITGITTGDHATLVGGPAISLFTVTGADSLAVSGASGTTGIDASQSTGPETLATYPVGESGQLVGILGSGADTMIGGSGAATVTAGAGPDIFGFVNGHAGGKEVIIGFTAADNIAFSGYGYSIADLPLEAMTATGDLMTLNDGTEILFAGLSHKLFSV